MKRLCSTLVLALMMVGLSIKYSEGEDAGTAQSAPAEVQQAFESQGLTKGYAFIFHLKPSYLRGDFNGDGKLGTAIQIEERGTGKIGFAIINGGTGKVFIVGAGKPSGNGGDDLSGINFWELYSKGSVSAGADGSPPPILKGDAILIGHRESTSALIFWDGGKYSWYQQGD